MNQNDTTVSTTQKSDHLAALTDPAQEAEVGFALPETVLHSIPLSAEFEAVVQSAADENRVSSPLPKYFNPLFRRQGVVNKHLIQAVQEVGASLGTLAREIETRDRVLETLAAHLNRQGKILFDRQLQLAREAGAARVSGNALMASARAGVERHRETETAVANLTSKLDAQSGEVSRLAGHVSGVEKQLQATSDQVSRALQWEPALTELLRRVANLEAENKVLAKNSEVVSAENKALAAEIASLRVNLEETRTAQQKAVDSTLASVLEAGAKALGAQIDSAITPAPSTPNSTPIEGSVSRVDEVRPAGSAALAFFARLEQIVLQLNQLSTAINALKSSGAAGEIERAELQEGARQIEDDFNRLFGLFEKIAGEQRSTISSLGTTLSTVGQLLPDLQARLQEFQNTGVEARAESASKVAEIARTATAAANDGIYLALEARFRGPRALIKDRQRIYLDTIKQALQRIDRLPPPERLAEGEHPLTKLAGDGPGVLDLGCGRGEWLELLRENGIPGLGIDTNRYFLEICARQELPVLDADLVEFLRNAPSESAFAITAFHVIEHLPVPVFLEAVRHMFRIVRRGGVVILETPNPQNILAGSYNFLLDPTHLRPVHPEFGRFVLESCGFAPVELKFLSPNSEQEHVGQAGDPLADRFNFLFYGPQDYGLIGVKP